MSPLAATALAIAVVALAGGAAFAARWRAPRAATLLLSLAGAPPLAGAALALRDGILRGPLVLSESAPSFVAPAALVALLALAVATGFLAPRAQLALAVAGAILLVAGILLPVPTLGLGVALGLALMALSLPRLLAARGGGRARRAGLALWLAALALPSLVVVPLAYGFSNTNPDARDWSAQVQAPEGARYVLDVPFPTGENAAARDLAARLAASLRVASGNATATLAPDRASVRIEGIGPASVEARIRYFGRPADGGIDGYGLARRDVAFDAAPGLAASLVWSFDAGLCNTPFALVTLPLVAGNATALPAPSPGHALPGVSPPRCFAD